MNDTNDMRSEFEAWYYEIENVSMRCERLHDLTIRRDAFFATWQAATERATAIERERCAKVCELLKEGALSIQTGPTDDLSNVMIRQVAHLGAGACAEAIRLGGAG